MLHNNKNIIEQFDLKFHLVLLGSPLILLILCWMIFFSAISQYQSMLTLSLVCIIYILGYSLSYYLHQGRLNRATEHLQQMHCINDITFELIPFSDQYENEASFLNALLKKAVSCIDGAEMGTIIRIDPSSNALYFESSVGIDLNKLRQVDFNLNQSFEHRFTDGRCDRVVIIDNMKHINEQNTLTKNEKTILFNAPIIPIYSTLSSPIHIDGQLYGLLNLDSGSLNAFNEYDSHLVKLLTHEAANAINLYQKSKEIQKLTFHDPQTGLYNRNGFEKNRLEWKIKPHFGSYLVLLNIDNLTSYNKTAGYDAGNKAIHLLCHHLQARWKGEQLMAYLGGNEFIMLCHGPQSQLKTQLIDLQSELIPASQQVNLTLIKINFGIATYQGQWDAAFLNAKHALKQMKQAHPINTPH
ncbi:diguanylate cyclase domain-containing protein [Shewanella surugensis]|uniref:Diguanylate cyclase n=1 Tax=Shewanella surugensis TaxID=212020 RepID=A0ABT0LHK3_9GAMM|nr:diguanylate cyclase [Shewanella surugensis]MCL1127181.1 diguanylate cyclase [Shewanella surugensis]